MRTGTAYWGYTHPSKPSAILLGVRVYFSHSSARTFLQAWGLKNMASLCHPLLFPFSSLSPAFTSFQTSELCWLVFNEVFFHRLVVLSLTIKNSQLLEAENKIWPEVNWECNLIIGVDIFKSLCLKKKKRLWEKGGICHGMNICLSTLEWGLPSFPENKTPSFFSGRAVAILMPFQSATINLIELLSSWFKKKEKRKRIMVTWI